jgi:hypothetical protein
MTCARVALVWPFLLMMSVCAQAQTDFSATSVKVDAVMQPKRPGDAFKECANDPVCSSIIGGAATYLGVPSTLVSGSLRSFRRQKERERKATIRLRCRKDMCTAAHLSAPYLSCRRRETGRRLCLRQAMSAGLRSTPGLRNKEWDREEAGLRPTT